MESVHVIFYDPEMNLNGRAATRAYGIDVDLAPIRTKFGTALQTYEENEREKRPSLFEFSFFTAFGIPPYSHIDVLGHFGVNWTPGLKHSIVQSILAPFNANFKNPDNMHTTQRSNYISFIYHAHLPGFVGHELHKIHLFVKHEYIAYAILKLATLPANFLANKFIYKFQLFNRTSNLRPENTELHDIRVDGGVVPTIVIYGSSDPAIMTQLLRLVMNLFPEHDRIGLMEDRGTMTLSPFNVRLNKLVSYAAGDRGRTLDAMLRNISNIDNYTEYTIPRWLLDLQRGCSADGREDVNRQSQLFLGIDACDESGAAINYTEKCKTRRTPDMKYCYITKSPDMVDPRTFIGGKRRSVRLLRGKRGVSRRNKRLF